MATPFKLRNGMLLLSTEAPGGIYNAAQLKKIAELCEGDAAIVKATEDQRLALFVAPEKAKQVAAELKATGLGIRNYQDGLHQPVNCIGELCGDHLQDAMGLSMDLSQELAKVTLSSAIKIGINGCARCCVPTHTLDISVIGDSTGYRVSLGGKNSQIPEMASFMAEGVPAAKLPKMLSAVVGIYKELANAGEALQDVMERCGSGRFVEALAPYSQDAAGNGDEDLFGVAGTELAAADLATDDGDGLDAGTDAGMDMDMGAELAGDAGPAPTFDEEGGDPLLTDDSGLMPDQMLESEPGIEPLSEGDIPLDDGFGLGVEMDDIAITPADAAAMLPDDLAPFPDDDSMPEGLLLIDSMEELEGLSGLEPEEIDDLPPLATPAQAVAKSAPAPAPAPAAVKPAAARPVALAPAVEAIGSEDDADLAAAIEVDGDEADAFEAKLEESIADEESHPPAEDENSAERLAAMQLVESGADVPSVEAVRANLGVDDSFDNLEIDHNLDDDLDEELLTGGANGPEMLEASAIDDDMPDVAAGFEPEEIAFDEPAVAAVTPLTVKTPARGAPRAPAPTAGGFEFKGIDVGDGGRLTLSFSSGATVVLDPRTMVPGMTRDFTVGGKKIVITQAAAGFSVDVDGVGIFLPVQAA